MREAREVSEYLKKYNNLYFDIFFWMKDATCMKTDEYAEMFEKYSNRFIFGLDLTEYYSDMQKKYFTNYISALDNISKNAKENIFYNNMRRFIDFRKRNLNKD